MVDEYLSSPHTWFPSNLSLHVILSPMRDDGTKDLVTGIRHISGTWPWKWKWKWKWERERERERERKKEEGN